MPMDVDDLFVEAGQCGLYQVNQYILLAFPILFSSYQTVSYIFTTGTPDYRCLVPECEKKENADFMPSWIHRAVPFHHGSPAQCIRYRPGPNITKFINRDTCAANFNPDITTKCREWVFKDKENTIVSEFLMLCPENTWKVALVGTTNYLGFFIGMPVAGIFADRYGRKKVLILSCFIQSLVGVLRSFSPNYIVYLVLQFFGAFMSGAYNAGFVLALETVGPQKRVLGNAIICCFHSLGEAVVGFLMWGLQDWRLLSRFLFLPGLFSLAYFWLIPESIRWLITKGKTEEALTIFNEVARVNKKKLSPTFNSNLIEMSKLHEQNNQNTKEVSNGNSSQVKRSSSLKEILKSSRLILRIMNCTVCWMVITMVFFGLSLTSVTVAGHKYLNFIFTVLVELPGYLSTWLLMDVIKVGRRLSLIISFFLTGVTCITFYFLSGHETAQLVLFLVGKFSITFAFAVVYIFTAEMFPTELRNSLLGVCSMAGHIGSMLAPQTALLVKHGDPMLIWGVFSLLAGSLATLFPETLNSKLPDTIADAEKIGV